MVAWLQNKINQRVIGQRRKLLRKFYKKKKKEKKKKETLKYNVETKVPLFSEEK